MTTLKVTLISLCLVNAARAEDPSQAPRAIPSELLSGPRVIRQSLKFPPRGEKTISTPQERLVQLNPGDMIPQFLREGQGNSPSGTTPDPIPQPPAAQPPGVATELPVVRVDDSGMVTLHLDNVDIRQAIELLSRQGAINLLVAPGVTGQVTVNLDRVTLNQALAAILKLGNLTARREGGLIYVYAAEEADLLGAARQLTTRVYYLNYVRSIDVSAMIDKFMSPNGKISFTPPSDIGISGGVNLFGPNPMGGGGGGGGGGGASGSGVGGATTGGNLLAGRDVLVVQDDEDVLRTIDEIIRRLDVQPMQVLVEAVIVSVELDRTVDLGVNFAVLDHLGGPNLTVSGNGSDISSNNIGFLPGAARILAAGGKIAGNTTNGFDSNTHGIKFGFIGKRVDGFIRALETVGEVNVLASPRVLVLNKQRAEIQLGQRLGYQTLTQNLTSTVQQVQFLNTGTLLRFRPFVSSDGMIRMEVHPERSSGEVVNNLPSSNTSEVTTNVLIPDGATLVIGGLIENTDTTTQQGVLGLSRLPVVGPLFRQKQQVSTKRELIVLLTPRIWNQAGIQGPLPLVAPGASDPACIVPLTLDAPAEAAERAARAVAIAAAPPATPATAPTLAPPPPVPPPAAPPEPMPAAPNPNPGPTPPRQAVVPAPAVGRRVAQAGLSIHDPAVAQAGYSVKVRPDANATPGAIRAARPEEPGSGPPSTRRVSARHVVKSGENFWTISRYYYGTGRYYKALWAANRDQADAPDQLVVGTTVNVPPVGELDRSLVETPPRPSTPQPADTSGRAAVPKGWRPSKTGTEMPGSSLR